MAIQLLQNMPWSLRKGMTKGLKFNSAGQDTAAAVGNSYVSKQPFARWTFEVALDHVQGNESLSNAYTSVMMGAYMACCGRAFPFLFVDPQDSQVVTMPFGVGDGSTKNFQLSRSVGGATDIIQFPQGSINVYNNGSLTSAYSLSNTGVVQFTSAPAIGAVLSWTGSFAFYCRFDEDTMDMVRDFTTNNGVDQWSIESIKFTSEFAPSTLSGLVVTGLGGGGTFTPATLNAVVTNPTGSQTINSFPLFVTSLGSQGGTLATFGFVRMSKTDTIDWRNNANTANLALGINGSDQLTFNGSVVGGGSGTVTSVAMTLPSFMGISGSPITTSGTLAVSFNSQTANTILAAPNGSSGAPIFRALVAADVPTLNQNTTGTSGGLSGTPAITVGNITSTGSVNLTSGTILLPKVSGNSYATTAAGLSVGASGAGNAALGDGTNGRIIPMTLFKGLEFSGTGNVTALASVLGTPTYSQGSLTMVANQQTVGNSIHIVASGHCVVGTAGTVTFQVFLDGQGGWTATTGSLATSVSAWQLDIWIFCSATGTSGTAAVRTYGSGIVSGAASAAQIQGSFASITTDIDTTNTSAIDLQAKFGTTNASNTVVCDYCEISLG